MTWDPPITVLSALGPSNHCMQGTLTLLVSLLVTGDRLLRLRTQAFRAAPLMHLVGRLGSKVEEWLVAREKY